MAADGDPIAITRRAYEADHERYAAVNADRSSVAPMLEALAAGLEPGDLVVDLGCGPGWETGALTDRGFRVVAFDITAEMLRVTARDRA